MDQPPRAAAHHPAHAQGRGVLCGAAAAVHVHLQPHRHAVLRQPALLRPGDWPQGGAVPRHRPLPRAVRAAPRPLRRPSLGLRHGVPGPHRGGLELRHVPVLAGGGVACHALLHRPGDHRQLHDPQPLPGHLAGQLRGHGGARGAAGRGQERERVRRGVRLQRGHRAGLLPPAQRPHGQQDLRASRRDGLAESGWRGGCVGRSPEAATHHAGELYGQVSGPAARPRDPLSVPGRRGGARLRRRRARSLPVAGGKVRSLAPRHSGGRWTGGCGLQGAHAGRLAAGWGSLHGGRPSRRAGRPGRRHVSRRRDHVGRPPSRSRAQEQRTGRCPAAAAAAAATTTTADVWCSWWRGHGRTQPRCPGPP
mmetsp:Transcript_4301/g.18178  ORF Transcript_4301/g.18178 Transcript_4301/m.18178 type:complete len:364 (-) Transcript_4301:233-1324(-)